MVKCNYSMNSESQTEAKVERRARLIDALEDAYASRLAKTLPRLEKIIFDSPDQEESDFMNKAEAVVKEYDLSRVQRELIRRTFWRYRRDREEILAYRDLVMGEERKGSKTPFGDIDSDPKAKRVFLEDVEVRGLEKDEDLLEKFHLEDACPSCFVIRFDGTAKELKKVLSLEKERLVAGIYVRKINLEERDKELSPEKRARLELLDRKYLFFINPPPEEKKLEISKPEETRAHEIRHYLFRLYWEEEEHHDKLTFIDENARNELQANLLVDSWYFHLDELLQGPFPDSYGGGEIYLREFPEFVEQLIDCLYKVKRLAVTGYKDHALVGNTILTASSLPEATRRLRKLGEMEVDPIRVYDGLLFFRNHIESPKQERGLDNNLVFFEAVIKRALAVDYQPAERRNKGLEELVRTLAWALKGHVFQGIGITREEIYVKTPVVVASVKRLKQLFLDDGFTKVGPLDNLIRKAKEQVSEEKRQEEHEHQWAAFIGWLTEAHPDLAERYERLAVNSKKRGRLKLVRFVKEELDLLSEAWKSQRQ